MLPVRSVWVVCFGCAAVALEACSAGSNATAVRTAAPAQPRSATSVTTPRTVVSPEEALTVEEMLARARSLFAQGRMTEAAREFDRVAQLDREGTMAPAALLEGAEAHEAAGDRSASVDRLENLSRRFPRHPSSQEALVRALRLNCYLERWQRAGNLADLLLAKNQELRPMDRIVTYSGKALSLVFQGDAERASEWVDRGRVLVDELRLDSAGRVPRDLAQLYFALGEIRGARARQIRFRPLPPDFSAALEARCQLLLDAQGAYSDAMRAYDAHWSAMAGYRVGELYQNLYQDLMPIEPPRTADTPALRELFEGTLRLRFSVLLDKALAMMEHTLALSARTGEQSRWVLEAERAKQSLVEARRTEQAALARLPYTRVELEREIERQACITDRLRASGSKACSRQDKP